jgi:hypothetical protein
MRQASHTVIVGDVGVALTGTFYGPVTINTPLTQSIAQYRQTLINSVRSYWLTKFLPSTFDQSIHIALKLVTKQEFVETPSYFKTPAQLQSTEISDQITELQLFHAYGQRLLVLGAPGAGKTIFLVRLLRDLLQTTEEHPTSAIPVILDLGSWSSRHRSFSGWIVDRLRKDYQVTRRCARTLLRSQALVLLFDGFDEVPIADRSACIDALNEYTAAADVPMVVCSRRDDYLQLSKLLRLRSAFEIEALDPQQVDDFLVWVGDQAQGVREALDTDEHLRSLITTPLMLSVLVNAYPGRSVAQIQTSGSVEQRRQQIFAAYIETMLSRRAEHRYFRHSTVRLWLGRLATAMSQQTGALYVEDLQPTWFATDQQRTIYWLIVCSLGILFAVALFALLGFLVAGLIATAVHLVDDRELDLAILIEWAQEGAQYGAIGGAIGVLFAIARSRTIRLPHVFAWSTLGLYSGWLPALGFGIIGSVLSGLAFWLWIPEPIELLSGGILGILVGLIVLVIYGFANGTMVRSSSAHQVLSRAAWLVFGLWVVAVIASLGAVGAIMLFQSLMTGDPFMDNVWFMLAHALRLSTCLSAITALVFGGWSFWQHLVVRVLLARSQVLPLRLSTFLNYAADLLLLRPVGHGYVFVHALIQEQLAQQLQRVDQEQQGG